MLSSIYAKLILGYFTLLLIFILTVSSVRSMGGHGNSGNGNSEFRLISSPQNLCPGGNLVADDSVPLRFKSLFYTKTQPLNNY